MSRITGTIFVVFVLAVLASVLALASAWRSRALIQRTLAADFTGVARAKELESALLEQRGNTSYYLLTGDLKWVERLNRLKPHFPRVLDEYEASARTDADRRVLQRLRRAYALYDSSRNEVLALFDAGQPNRARALLTGQVAALADSAHALCSVLVAGRTESIQHAMNLAGIHTIQTTLMVSCLLLLLAALCLTFLGFLFRGVIRPIRNLAQDARSFAVAGASSVAPPGPVTAEPIMTDVNAIGFYLRSLMSEVAEGRENLEQHRQRMLHSEKLATVGRLSAGIAHEIRGPLTCIQTWLYSLRRFSVDNPRATSACDMVSQEVARLESLVRNLQEFTRPPQLTLTTQPVQTLIDGSLRLIGHHLREKGIGVVRENGTPDAAVVVADSGAFQQVMINLLTNAAEAMPSGGQVFIGTAIEPGEGDRASVVVRIRDQGTGVPDGIRESMFQPFVTAKSDGMGLGLSIASEIMRLHGGELVLESSTPQGSVFALRFPAWKEPRK